MECHDISIFLYSLLLAATVDSHRIRNLVRWCVYSNSIVDEVCAYSEAVCTPFASSIISDMFQHVRKKVFVTSENIDLVYSIEPLP